MAGCQAAGSKHHFIEPMASQQVKLLMLIDEYDRIAATC
jgi:hypothetical protein